MSWAHILVQTILGIGIGFICGFAGKKVARYMEKKKLKRLGINPEAVAS